jgi:hypothetical protein
MKNIWICSLALAAVGLMGLTRGTSFAGLTPVTDDDDALVSGGQQQPPPCVWWTAICTGCGGPVSCPYSSNTYCPWQNEWNQVPCGLAYGYVDPNNSYDKCYECGYPCGYHLRYVFSCTTEMPNPNPILTTTP